MIGSQNNRMPDFCSRRFTYHYTTAVNLLMKMGVDIGNINILAVGRYENYKGEVREQKPPPGESIDKNTKITLKIGYSSAVDFMPYQFFYGLEGIRSSEGGWEDRAREFMAPFDSAIIKGESEARFQKLKYDFGILDPEHLTRVLHLFDFEPTDKIDDINEMLFWVSVFPAFHHWAGNPESVERILSHLFGFEFKIVENTESEYDIPESVQYRLGSKSGRLGRESVMGRTFIERDSSFDLIIKRVRPEQAVNLLPGKPLRRKIEGVLGFCLPSDLDCHIKIKIDAGRTRIGRESGNCYLGYTTHV